MSPEEKCERCGTEVGWFVMHTEECVQESQRRFEAARDAALDTPVTLRELVEVMRGRTNAMDHHHVMAVLKVRGVEYEPNLIPADV